MSCQRLSVGRPRGGQFTIDVLAAHLHNMHHVLAPHDYRRVAWKNGGGFTTEIACEPPGAGTAHFHWRVSVADVESDGPFSLFPGVERTLVLLRGAGMHLYGGTGVLEAESAYEPVTFAGDLPLSCQLVAGPVRDFNLMVARTRWVGAVDVVRSGAKALAPAQCYVLYAAAGDCDCIVPGHAPVTVPPLHALVMRADDAAPMTGVAVHVRGADAAGIVAILNPASGESPFASRSGAP
jgi:environmental stress-induced protein Ves